MMQVFSMNFLLLNTMLLCCLASAEVSQSKGAVCSLAKCSARTVNGPCFEATLGMLRSVLETFYRSRRCSMMQGRFIAIRHGLRILSSPAKCLFLLLPATLCYSIICIRSSHRSQFLSIRAQTCSSAWFILAISRLWTFRILLLSTI